MRANTIEELAGSTICVTEGSDELAMEKTFRDRGIEINIQLYGTIDEAFKAYQSGACEVLSGSRTSLGGFRAAASQPDNHVILQEAISINPYGPISRLEDPNWTEILRWTILCTINAEALGINRRNVNNFVNSDDPNISTLLGNNGALGESLRLRSDFCYQIIRQVGNYAEIYERHFGLKTPFGIPRGQNALYQDGGLFYPQFSFQTRD
jgi:general L-amino acid transport system substrate-binding protein